MKGGVITPFHTMQYEVSWVIGCLTMVRTYEYKKSRSYTKKDGTISYYNHKVKYKPDYKGSNDYMYRTDKGSKHRRLNCSFTQEEERIIKELDKDVQIGKKIHNIINYLKTNGMYSNQEMELESMNIDRLKVGGEEKDVLNMTWEVRQKIHDRLIANYKAFLIDFLAEDNPNNEKEIDTTLAR